MWLSLLPLNLRSRSVRTDLRDCHHLHRTVMRMFGDVDSENARESLGVLYRVEQDRGAAVRILVQSAAEPDPSRLDPEYCRTLPHFKNIREPLDALVVGQRFRFRLRANPTRSVLPEKGANGLRGRGKRVELRGEQPCQEWIRHQGQRHGFQVTACRLDAGPPDPRVVGGKLSGHRQGATVTVATSLFDGLLAVSDADLFRNAITQGIGRAKSYGQGLLSIAAAPAG